VRVGPAVGDPHASCSARRSVTPRAGNRETLGHRRARTIDISTAQVAGPSTKLKAGQLPYHKWAGGAVNLNTSAACTSWSASWQDHWSENLRPPAVPAHMSARAGSPHATPLVSPQWPCRWHARVALARRPRCRCSTSVLACACSVEGRRRRDGAVQHRPAAQAPAAYRCSHLLRGLQFG
jgi:hypothetical protein